MRMLPGGCKLVRKACPGSPEFAIIAEVCECRILQTPHRSIVANSQFWPRHRPSTRILKDLSVPNPQLLGPRQPFKGGLPFA